MDSLATLLSFTPVRATIQSSLRLSRSLRSAAVSTVGGAYVEVRVIRNRMGPPGPV
jgi:hypothetical protein